jgi:type VI secretion system secreted protein Hcp
MKHEIKGSVTQSGREDSIMIIATSHSVSSRRDAASGLPTGKRQHQPFRITKEIDQASPLLMNALVMNENITKWRLDYRQPSKTGAEFQFYSVELVNARVTSIQQEMLNNKYAENMQHKEREHISFVYEEIIWTFQDGGVTSQDKWGFAAGGEVLVSDLTGDGIVNVFDLVILAREWMMNMGW